MATTPPDPVTLMRGVVRDIAVESPYYLDGMGEPLCFFCDVPAEEPHETPCAWRRAREVLDLH